jgi:hypothetical protein
MNTPDKLGLSVYTSNDIESFLRNYELMVKSLPEVAEWWPEMDDFERQHARLAYFGEAWAPRRVLGALYHAGQLTAEQEAELAALDDELIRHLDEANLCYGLDLQSVAQLFTWGTPLAQSDEIIRIPIRPRTLSQIAPALAAIGANTPLFDP